MILYQLLPFVLLYSAQTFILEMSQGNKRCYQASLSPDKTLDVRFGFPRREKDNCEYRLTINRLVEDEEQQQHVSLLNKEFFCYEMSLREHFVYKHTAKYDEYDGQYEICAQNLKGFSNKQTYIQLLIRQSYDPSMHMDPDSSVPLVQSSDLMQLNELIMRIKKSLSWCQVHVQQAQNMGDKVEVDLQKSQETHKMAAIIQIMFLMLYGVGWIFVVRGLKKTW